MAKQSEKTPETGSEVPQVPERGTPYPTSRGNTRIDL